LLPLVNKIAIYIYIKHVNRSFDLTSLGLNNALVNVEININSD